MRILRTRDDVTPDIERCIEDALNWFDDEGRLPTEEFIDRLCNSYGGDDFDMESYDNEAAREVMRIARQIRREGR